MFAALAGLIGGLASAGSSIAGAVSGPEDPDEQYGGGEQANPFAGGSQMMQPQMQQPQAMSPIQQPQFMNPYGGF